MSDWWLIEHSLSLVLDLLVRDPTEISEARGRWSGQNMDDEPANDRPTTPPEHPLPHCDEISSACSAGNVTLDVGKEGTTGNRLCSQLAPPG